MTLEKTPGRVHQRTEILTVQQATVLVAIGLGILSLVAWHVALATTSGIPYSDYPDTLRGLLNLTPLTVPERYTQPTAGVTIGLFAVLVIGTCVGVYLLAAQVRGLARRRRGKVGLATRSQARQSAGEIHAREKAAWTRRASVESGLLNTATCTLPEVGLLLGHTVEHDEPVILTLEDQVAVLAPTGAGKTLYLMIGAALDAPGPLVVTSTRPEVLDALVEARGKLGQIHVFDPLDASHWPVPMVWDPVANAGISQHATALGESFAAGFAADTGTTEFFQAAASRVIARLLHAAALGGRNMETVLKWALDLARSQEALDILLEDPRAEIMWAQTLRGASEGADDTVASTRMTLGAKVDPILSRLVLRQMIPVPGVPTFDPAAFVRSNDTLVLITDDQAQTNVAPLTTMLLGAVVDAAKAAAALSMTGVLDPPMRVVGDEIANVAPLPKLPGLLSDSRGTGIQWIIAFQSLAQVFARWGEDEGRQILANLNCSLVLGGLQDERALERFSALVGEVDLTEVSAQLDGNGLLSGHTVTTTERTALRQEEIRGLTEGQALVIYRNSPAMIVNMIRWRDRPDGPEVAAAIQRIRKLRINPEPLAVDG